MISRIAIKSGILEILINLFVKQMCNCITIRLKCAILRTIIGLIRFSPKAASTSWNKLKKELPFLLFSEDTSTRIWSVKYISTVIKMVEVNNEKGVTLSFLQPLELCPSFFVSMYDECLPVRLQTIIVMCRIVISPDNRKECKQLVYMGLIGLFLDILKQQELKNCVNGTVIPIVISLNKLIKLSEKWSMVFINSNGVEIVLNYLKHFSEKVVISVTLLINNVSSYSSFHTNKVLENDVLQKFHKIKELTNSDYFIKMIDKVIFSLIMRCTEYEIIYPFITSCGDPCIIENANIQHHLKNNHRTHLKLRKLINK
ncbi:Armadillo-type fold containing protein [Cryptosporidium felis]|nr:Armadillo-type fold containing protein [Cryptosporidium felis]